MATATNPTYHPDNPPTPSANHHPAKTQTQTKTQTTAEEGTSQTRILADREPNRIDTTDDRQSNTADTLTENEVNTKMTEPQPPQTEPPVINQMAAETASSIELIEDMADALMSERQDLRDIIDRHLAEIKSALVGQYFAEAFEPEPEPSRSWRTAPDLEDTEEPEEPE